MKHLAVLMLAACGGLAVAQDPARDAGAPAGKPAAESMATMPMHARMQGRMQEMRALMDKIDKTKDPKAREQLLQQHLKAMHEQMDDMKRMGGMMDCHDPASPRMNMMMDMMGQMLHREDAQGGPH